ncbi:AraC family transcriptional regulator [Ancylobacter terrae]|uniref:AraC family transcriptional regulator n=1 Tax=Ancylobacter sp. sgz301288 TaxID=3342077 RepID=UPI00385BE06F
MKRLSTEDVPPRERLAFLHDFVGKHAAGMRFVPDDSARFRADLAVLPLPGNVMVGAARYTGVSGDRGRDLLGDGRADYQLMIHAAAHQVAVDGGEPVEVGAGDLMLIDQGVAMRCRLPATDLLCVNLDRARLDAMVPRIAARPLRVIPRSAPNVALFAGYANLVCGNPPADEASARAASDHLYQLAALVLGECPDAISIRRGVGASRLALVKQDILSRLRDPELDIAAVARRQRVTPRYIQRLFGAEGTTFSDFLREARLDCAFRALARAGGGPSIAAIAFDAGFGDLSSFNRAFRRRYGRTPSEVRGEALRRRPV